MKKTLCIAVLSLATMNVNAAPTQACLERVQSAVKNAVGLFPKVDQQSIQVASLRTVPTSLQGMEGEAAEPGYRVYTTTTFKEKKTGQTVHWLSESGVVEADAPVCSVLYSKLDVVN